LIAFILLPESVIKGRKIRSWGDEKLGVSVLAETMITLIQLYL